MTPFVIYVVLLRLRFAGRFARVNKTEETDARGWKKVHVGFDVEDMACEYAVSFGPNLEMIEPAMLRERVIAADIRTIFFGGHGNTPATS